MATELRDGFVEVDRGVRLHVVEAGSGPLVVLLHGFPEFWYVWRYQLAALADAGFRAVAVDLRGYNLSDKPSGVAAYTLPVLARDVAQLIHGLGARSASVVGHDWGGTVAWAFAMAHPEKLEHLVIINAPHPGTFGKHLLRPAQLRKSWYLFFFQLPWLPEAAMRAGGFASVRRELGEAAYVEAIGRPGALTAALNYYRGIFRGGPSAVRRLRRRVQAPVLVIWGLNDRFLGPALAQPEPALAPNARVERIADAGHWVQLERPELVSALLVAFLQHTNHGAPDSGATLT